MFILSDDRFKVKVKDSNIHVYSTKIYKILLYVKCISPHIIWIKNGAARDAIIDLKSKLSESIDSQSLYFILNKDQDKFVNLKGYFLTVLWQ